MSTTTAFDIDAAHERLRLALSHYDALVVAFSGGADSALLAFVATSVLGTDRVLCATALSPSLATDELEDASALAREWGLRHRTVVTHELEDANYVENTLQRCYFCKQELMSVLSPIAEENGATVALGVNLDDLGDWRPGQQAAREQGGVFPLVEAGLSKAEVRNLSRQLGLRTWDKPAAACLSSRVPHGTPVTIGVLSTVDRAESALRRLGFSQLRVRHYGEVCRIELEVAELAKAIELREPINQAMHRVGYDYVTLDLEGFRSGNLSQAELERVGEKHESKAP